MFNYELKALYSIRIRLEDKNGFIKEKVYIVRILNAHEYPTNIWLSKTEIEYGSPENFVIGKFIVNDEDSDETFTFTLVKG